AGRHAVRSGIRVGHGELGDLHGVDVREGGNSFSPSARRSSRSRAMFALRRKLLGSCSGPAQGSAAMSTTGECQMRRSTRTILAAAAAARRLGGLPPAAHAAPTPQDEPQLLLVHGHGRPDEGTNCNGTGGTWADALNYFEGAGGLDRDRMTTVAYYEGNAA